MTPCSDHGVLELKAFDGRTYQEICNQLLMVLQCTASDPKPGNRAYAFIRVLELKSVSLQSANSDGSTSATRCCMLRRQRLRDVIWPRNAEKVLANADPDIVTFLHSAMALYRIRMNQGNLQEFSFFSRLLTLGSKIPQLVPNGLSRQVMR
jgi:hypothetical protein